MISRTRIFALPLLGVLAAGCVNGDTPGHRIMFQIEGPLADALTDIELVIYQNPDASLCEPTAMASPSPWTPTAQEPWEPPIIVTWGTAIEREFNVGTWGFVVRGGASPEYPIHEKDAARGCVIEELGRGANPPLQIPLQKIFYPGVCGDGTLDPEEMCDDGGVGTECSLDCLSTPTKRVHSTTDGNQIDPALDGGGEGFLLAFTSDTDPDMVDDGQNARVQRLDAKGNLLSIGVRPDVRLNTYTDQPQLEPSIVLNATNLHASWLDFNNIGTDDGDVRLRTVDINSGSGALEEILNADTPESQLQVVLAGRDGIGTQIAAWTNRRPPSPQDVVCRRIVDGLAETAAEAPCSSETTGNQNQPAVAMSSTGTYVVAWAGPDASGTGVWLRIFSIDGTPVGNDIAVNTTTSGEQTRPSVAFDSQDRILVAWRDVPPGGQAAIRGRIFDVAGTASGDDFVVSPGPASTADDRILDVAGGTGRSGGVFIVVWHSPGTGVVGRLVEGHDSFGINRLNSAGVGMPFTDTGEFSIALESEYPSITEVRAAVSVAGESLVVWTSTSGDTDIWGRIIPTS